MLVCLPYYLDRRKDFFLIFSGAYRTAVQMGFKETLHCILCLAENAVGPESMRPDDIITLYSGKTVGAGSFANIDIIS